MERVSFFVRIKRVLVMHRIFAETDFAIKKNLYLKGTGEREYEKQI